MRNYVIATVAAIALAGCGTEKNIPPLGERQTSFTPTSAAECTVTYDPDNRPAKVECLSGTDPYLCLHANGYESLCRSSNRRKLTDELGRRVEDLIEAEAAVRQGMENAERSD